MATAQFLYYSLALIAVIAVVCIFSFCYRSFYCGRICGYTLYRHDVDPNTEIVIETTAVIEVTNINIADVEYSKKKDLKNENEKLSDIEENKKLVPKGDDSEAVAIAVAHPAAQLSDGARPVLLMESVSINSMNSGSARLSGRNNRINTITPTRITEENLMSSSYYETHSRDINRVSHSSALDHDYLIETNRNMHELNLHLTNNDIGEGIQNGASSPTSPNATSTTTARDDAGRSQTERGRSVREQAYAIDSPGSGTSRNDNSENIDSYNNSNRSRARRAANVGQSNQVTNPHIFGGFGGIC